MTQCKMQLGQVAHLGGYVVIILATLLTNLLVLVVLARGRPPVRARRHLILSLTACNVLLSLTVTLFYAISTGSNQWVFGSEYCLDCGSFYMHLNGTTILHLTATALSSFLYTKHSLSHSIIIIIWRPWEPGSNPQPAATPRGPPLPQGGLLFPCMHPSRWYLSM